MNLRKEVWEFIGAMKEEGNVLLVNFRPVMPGKINMNGGDVIACGDLTAIAEYILSKIDSGEYPSGFDAKDLHATVPAPGPHHEEGRHVVIGMHELHAWARQHIEAVKYTEMVANA